MTFLKLFFTKPVFPERATAEMDPAYVAGLDKYGTIGILLLITVPVKMLNNKV